MLIRSRLRPSCGVHSARRRPGRTDSTGQGAGGCGNFKAFETLESRRLLSGTYLLSGPTQFNEGDYQLTLSVQGVPASTVQQWNIDWDGDGVADESVNPNGAASITVTKNLDGPAQRSIKATATLTDASVVAAESAGHSGALDPTFNSNGTTPGTSVGALGLVKSVALDTAGGTLVAYQREDDGLVALRRYTASGELDTDFGQSVSLGGGNFDHYAVVDFTFNTDDDALSIALQGGMIYVGGTSQNDLGGMDFALARFSGGGVPDLSFGPASLPPSNVRLYDLGAHDSIEALATQGGNLVAAGHSSGVFKMVRIQGPTGLLDPTFGAAGVAASGFSDWQPADLAVLPDQSIVTAGRTNGTGLRVAKFRSDGTTSPGVDGTAAWSVQPISFGHGLSAPIIVQPDGKVVVGGDVSGQVSLVRLNTNGSLDTSFDFDGRFEQGVSAFDTVYELALQPDGSIITLGGAEPGGLKVFAANRFRDNGVFVQYDAAFGGNTAIGEISEIRAAAVTPGGSIVAAGYSEFDPNSRIALARYGRDLGVSVFNVAPTLVITNPTLGVPGQVQEIRLVEPSAADRAAGYFGYVDFDYQGDDDVDGISFGADPVTGDFIGAPVPTHVYSATGTYAVVATVFDKDFEGNFADFSAVISNTVITADPVYPGKTMLLVGASNPGGAANNNTISVQNSGQGIRVVIDGVSTTFGAADRVLVYGNAGADEILVSNSVQVPVEVYGGAGNDRLRGGAGNDLLVGGDGIDLLAGGGGRDLLIGEGAYAPGVQGSIDRIVGDANDDILIGGYTSFADRRSALAAVQAEWNSGRTYTQRVNNLRDGTGSATRLNRDANGDDVFLAANVTVFDDGVVDILTGSNGQDWFFADREGSLFVRDLITDLSASEFADDLEFISA
jgi:uncharacterized delta-60 repeat protein